MIEAPRNCRLAKPYRMIDSYLPDNRGRAMAQTLLGKIKILVSATLHSIVDQALQSNSLGVFDEYIREAEESMEMLRSALADLAATIKTLKRKYEEAANEAAKLDLQVDEALR